MDSGEGGKFAKSAFCKISELTLIFPVHAYFLYQWIQQSYGELVGNFADRVFGVVFSCVLFPMQGDRFGGALDAAAKQFSEAYDSGLIPMEFVNDMRKKGKLIMGIGHRVKSVWLHAF